jgi:hypothetical protein
MLGMPSCAGTASLTSGAGPCPSGSITGSLSRCWPPTSLQRPWLSTARQRPPPKKGADCAAFKWPASRRRCADVLPRRGSGRWPPSSAHRPRSSTATHGVRPCRNEATACIKAEDSAAMPTLSAQNMANRPIWQSHLISKGDAGATFHFRHPKGLTNTSLHYKTHAVLGTGPPAMAHPKAGAWRAEEAQHTAHWGTALPAHLVFPPESPACTHINDRIIT